MIIYKATNKITNKSYIGQTICLFKKRKNEHRYSNDNVYFHNSIKKYGWDNFKWEIIEKCNSKEELDEMEFHYIKQYNTFKPNGYNMTMGGDKGTYGWIPSKETKEKISNSLKYKWKNDKEYRNKMEINLKLLIEISKNNNPMSGKKRPEISGELNPSKRMEVREKISKNNKSGNKEVREKISKGNKGKRLNKTYDEIFGVYNSSIIKKKQSISKKGKCGIYTRTEEEKEKHRLNHITKEYEFISPDNIIYKSCSIRQFSKEHNLNRCSLLNLVNGKNKSGKHKGWKGRVLRTLK